jgi:hypothetical protein
MRRAGFSMPGNFYAAGGLRILAGIKYPGVILMSLNDEELQLIEIICRLSTSQHYLTLSALNYQALGLAKRHNKEKAVDLANEMGKAIEPLLRSLKKKMDTLTESHDSPSSIHLRP